MKIKLTPKALKVCGEFLCEQIIQYCLDQDDDVSIHCVEDCAKVYRPYIRDAWRRQLPIQFIPETEEDAAQYRWNFDHLIAPYWLPKEEALAQWNERVKNGGGYNNP